MAWSDEAHINRCGTLAQQCTNKRRFSTRQRAKRAARLIFQDSGAKLRPYACRICEGYHLYSVKDKHQ